QPGHPEGNLEQPGLRGERLDGRGRDHGSPSQALAAARGPVPPGEFPDGRGAEDPGQLPGPGPVALRKPTAGRPWAFAYRMPPSPAPPDSLLPGWGIHDLARGARNLQGLAKHLGATLDGLLAPLGRALPRSPDPDLALNALERFFAHPAAAALLPDLLAADARKL